MLTSLNYSPQNNLKDYHNTFEIDGYSIEVSSTQSLDYIRKRWRELERRVDTPFFLTWQWISCWIKTYEPRLIVVSAKYQGKVVALGLFTGSTEIRHGIVRSYQLRLHQMGNMLMDQVWMEYNDFNCDETHRSKAVNSSLKALLKCNLKWDEIVLSMMSTQRATTISESIPHAELESSQPCYSVDLALLRKNNTRSINSLHANTRYQIRRSIRLYEAKHGKLLLKEAETTEEALALFHHAGIYHMQRWSDSGYKNRQFVHFHENLIKDCFETKNIVFLKLLAGEQTIAIMYYHIVGKTVFFYLHGLNYSQDKKLKPGLVAHTFATDYFMQQGMDEYDYMGGYSQYKEQLAKQSSEQVSVVIQRPRSRFSLEKMARNLKRRIMASKL